MDTRDYRPLTDNDIDAHLSRKPGYFGCLTKEELVDRVKDPKFKAREFGVINIDDDLNDETHGTHWVAFFHSKGNKYCYYFDSFGVTPDDTIKKFLKRRFRKTILYSQNILQDIDSALCGYYCIDWLNAMVEGVSYEDYLRNYGKDGRSNDKLMIERYTKLDI